MSVNQNFFLDKDVSLLPIKNKKIAIIGYGNQGRAQALNLFDSKLNVRVGLKENSPSIKIANTDGLKVLMIDEAVKWADIVCLLLPDKIMPDVYKDSIQDYLKKDQTLLFSHGYNIYYQKITIKSNINVIMVAPSGGGHLVREEYVNGSGVPALIAVEQDYSGKSLEIAKAYSKAIGSTKVCSFLSSFKEETETDIFGEQAILTGGLPFLINSAYNTLIKNGYDSTVAWFVCYYEVKTIVDLFYNKGFEEFYKLISDTARYGGQTRGGRLISKDFEAQLLKILDDIRSGSFNDELTNFQDNKKLPDSFNGLEKKTQEILSIIKDQTDENNNKWVW